MEFYLQNGKITGENDFNPKAEWKDFPVRFTIHMWFANGTIPFFEEHIHALNNRFENLHRPYNTEADDKLELHRLLQRLINKNKAYMGGWIRLEVFAGEKSWTFIARVIKHPRREIPYDEQGKLAIISDRMLRTDANLACPERDSVHFWACESLKIAGTRYSDAIFCNEDKAVASAIGANLFCISGNRLFTPSTASGYLPDNFRQLTLGAAAATGLEIRETDRLSTGDLLHMDEIFTVAESAGFRWILGIGMKRFVRKRSEVIRNHAEHLLWLDRTKK